MPDELTLDQAYDDGYKDCLTDINKVISDALEQEALQYLTGAMALRLMKTTIDGTLNKVFE